MIQKKTLPLIVVAIIAPTSRKAARPANSWHDSQDAKTISTNTQPPTIRSPFGPRPSVRQIVS